ncbi:hypothetical protein GUJ93_ZPchr0009g258 [Zizania palustris]|uniref:Uncharacterized protein n=1 Tax=Zizania palustris TaxID=103762 RepID=A0A8J5RHE8_ZIZPA|nr:hypothetical protein GUJ93_ZPchr0009g258 [Zizania palustris]
MQNSSSIILCRRKKHQDSCFPGLQKVSTLISESICTKKSTMIFFWTLCYTSYPYFPSDVMNAQTTICSFGSIDKSANLTSGIYTHSYSMLCKLSIICLLDFTNCMMTEWVLISLACRCDIIRLIVCHSNKLFAQKLGHHMLYE